MLFKTVNNDEYSQEVCVQLTKIVNILHSKTKQNKMNSDLVHLEGALKLFYPFPQLIKFAFTYFLIHYIIFLQTRFIVIENITYFIHFLNNAHLFSKWILCTTVLKVS